MAEAHPRAAVDSSPGPGRVGVWAAEDNFCQQPAGSCPPPALRYAAPRPPSRGSRSPGRAVPHPGAHPPRSPASSPSGPEGTTGQRGPESGPGCVGGGALLPHASCARGSAAPARAVAPSAAARLPGGRARAPGGSRAPSARGGEGGPGRAPGVNTQQRDRNWRTSSRGKRGAGEIRGEGRDLVLAGRGRGRGGGRGGRLSAAGGGDSRESREPREPGLRTPAGCRTPGAAFD